MPHHHFCSTNVHDTTYSLRSFLIDSDLVQHYTKLKLIKKDRREYDTSTMTSLKPMPKWKRLIQAGLLVVYQIESSICSF
jgi:hypothetical protein